MSKIIFGAPMKEQTSFRVGGPAQLFVEPANISELKLALNFIQEYHIPYLIIGNGSNLLVSDQGIKGAVIKIGENFSDIEIKDTTVIVGAGSLLSTFARSCAKRGLTGAEFAGGIPGSVGGAVAMNAGAYGGEMKDIVKWVELFNGKEIIRIDREHMEFSYRHSIVESEGYVVLRVSMELTHGVQEEIDAKMIDLAEKRRSKQPIHLPSAGSTFKRPEGYFAAKLIEDAGLKGHQIGGAQVSTLHAGFVVNVADATAKDVYDLIKHVQRVVFDQFQVKLETEVKILGEFE